MQLSFTPHFKAKKILINVLKKEFIGKQRLINKLRWTLNLHWSAKKVKTKN